MIRTALENAREADERRRHDGIDATKNPAQIPTSDPDSRVMPNKEGDYTPCATTDGQCGFIVDGEVLNEVNETPQVVPTVDRITENFGQQPAKFLADGGNASGVVQQALEERGVEVYLPSPEPSGNPAQRADLTQPVPEADWSQLPRNSKQQLDKSCFVYDAAEDQYYCPLGKPLAYAKYDSTKQSAQRVRRRVYQCQSCTGCPLAGHCISPQNQGGRTIRRDEFEEVRERTAQRMQTAEARALYNERPRIAETTFGVLKNVFGLRQFLLRGLPKVRQEWNWALTAFNLKKLVHHVARLRAKFANEWELASS